MKKKILFALLLALPFTLSAQTYVKFNALYWGLGVINGSVETKLNDKLTFNSDLVFSPWNSISGNAMLIGQLIPEVRYYHKGANNGFYVGAYAGGHLFKMTKWNYINTGKYQKGKGYALGLSIGYQIPINDRWRVDLYAGYGYQHSWYRGYNKNTGEQYVGLNKSGEWIPYKIGAAFAYRIWK